jgi:hypothetical protein
MVPASLADLAWDIKRSIHRGVDVVLSALPPRKKYAQHKAEGKVLLLENYLTGEPIVVPDVISWSSKVSAYNILGNNSLGDCTAAGAAHFEQTWTAANGSEFLPTLQQTIDFYSGSTGYNPADPSTDQGGVEADVLAYWKNTGFAGRKIAAFVAMDPLNWEHLRLANYLFGGVYPGVALPLNAQNQATWALDLSGTGRSAEPGSWGGHCPPFFDSTPAGVLFCTWGLQQPATAEWVRNYTSEAWAPLSSDWAQPGKVAPVGFDLAALQADLAQISA